MSQEMTSAERVLAVIQRKEPDRIPTMEWDIDPGIINTMTRGGTYEDFIVQLQHDAIMCGPSYEVRHLDDQYTIDEWGVVRLRGYESYAMPVDEKSPIQSWEDLEKWEPPDPYAPHRFDRMKEQVKRFKGKKAIFVRSRDVWSNPRDIMGYTRLFMECLDRPELVDAVVAKCIDQSIKVVQIGAELGAEVVITGDDIADNKGPMISPDLYKSLFMPHFRRFVSAVHDCGLYHWKHTDGNIMSLLDTFADAGVDGIDPIDPLGGMDLATVKKGWGDRMAIKGNVDCVKLLTQGTQQEVVEAVKACIRIAGPGGGYACSTSNSIHSGIKPNLYQTMIDTLVEYGVYPLDMDKLAPAP
jgi:uroporphyrinogen decarboxylase